MYIVTWRLPAHQRRRWNAPGHYDQIPERDALSLVREPREVGEQQHRKMNPGSGMWTVVACQRVEVREPHEKL